MDFSLLLVIATTISGLIWCLDSVIFKRRRVALESEFSSGQKYRSEPILVEYARSFFPVLFLVLVLRSFLFEPFRIPSGSMMPTLLDGDFIFVSKFSYGLRLPVINTKIFDIGEPARGDVVVFRLPADPSINYIKRVVGLPGDVVVYESADKELSINGEVVSLELIGDYEGNPGIQISRESLGDQEHDLLHIRSRFSPGGTYVVPEGHYFVMGDNRDISQDSRFESVRFIPEYHMVGKALRIWMNWRWPGDGGPRWGRIGQSIE